MCCSLDLDLPVDVVGVELVEDVVRALLEGQACEPGLVEPERENLRRLYTSAIVEVELEVSTMPGGVGVNERLRVPEGIKECREGLDLVRELCLSLRVCGEPEDLVDQTLRACALARCGDSSVSERSSSGVL